MAGRSDCKRRRPEGTTRPGAAAPDPVQDLPSAGAAPTGRPRRGTPMALVAAPDLPFLLTESRATPMHVGGLQVFELPEGAGPGWLREQFEAMLAHTEIAPLFRQRPYRSLRTGGQWAWREDDELDIEYHVRHSALPEPGPGPRAAGPGLAARTARSSTASGPLWEFHLIEGLEGNRFAAYTKVHHAMVDGVSALRLLERWLSTDPDRRGPAAVGRPAQGARGRRARRRQPARRCCSSTAKGAADIAGVAPTMLRSARRAMQEDLAAFPFKAPPTMLNVHITGARRIAAQTWSLARVKAVAKASDATLNDIVLAMCSGALRRYLVELGALPEESLTAMVPVSLRTDDSAGGNAVGAVLDLAGHRHPGPQLAARPHPGVDGHRQGHA